MKCFNHEERDAVGTCQSCGKMLCKECASKYKPCMCDECYDDNISQHNNDRMQQKRDALIDTNAEFVVAIIKGIICSVVLTFLFNASGTGTATTLDSVMFFFVPFGWAFITYLEQWIPVFFMNGPVFIVYIIIKFALSVVLGIPLFAIQILKYIFKMLTQIGK